ncbi:LCP family protein [Lipingzhangella sp. LS1_29]|uniref:LCP family protein n=1 Tax=Lipingzhangella rawalii TaxID=2055835 RepID=A0ABU2HBC6_9ACTN|nr:LCP family protein [Lipingzhangella rawalii]MDS1272586.1 LCP family protein [Lipingzhangella rawalii]
MSGPIKALSVTVTALIITGALVAYGMYWQVYGNINQSAVEDDILGPRPATDGESRNVLIIGSDERTGENAQYGRAEGARANVIILAHFHPDQDSAVLVSFPRDSVVQMPSCEPWEDFSGSDAYVGPINEALGNGGPPCVWRTIEQLTDIHVDHFVKMDMVGFRDIVDAVDGVPMCLPEPLSDERAQLDLPAGDQVLDGEDALAFVRARYNIGDGTDVGRVQRQQMFIGALAQEMMSREVLGNPQRTMDMLGAVTDALETDDGLSVDVMAGMAYDMRDADLGDIRFYTVPWEWSQTHEHRVEWIEDESQALFTAIANGTAVPDQDSDGDSDGATDAEAADDEDSTADARDDAVESLPVVVYNSTRIDGLAGEVADALGEREITVLDTVTGEPRDGTVLIRHGEGAAQAAEALAEEIDGDVQLEPGTPQQQGTLELYLTPAWSGLVPDVSDTDVDDADFTAEADPCADGLGGTGDTGSSEEEDPQGG